MELDGRSHCQFSLIIFVIAADQETTISACFLGKDIQKISVSACSFYNPVDGGIKCFKVGRGNSVLIQAWVLALSSHFSSANLRREFVPIFFLPIQSNCHGPRKSFETDTRHRLLKAFLRRQV